VKLQFSTIVDVLEQVERIQQQCYKKNYEL